MEDNNNLREKGWYWVKWDNGNPEIAFWNGNSFKFKDGGISDNENAYEVISTKIEFSESQQSESKWISVNTLPKHSEPILLWQENLSDPECSRHQKGVCFGDFFEIYPLTSGYGIIKKEKNYEHKDMEGDLCKITHWMPLPEKPKQ